MNAVALPMVEAIEEALPFVDSTEALAEWVRDANPGDKCVYYRGAYLISTPTVQFARHLEASGEVLFVQVRQGAGRFDYVAVRRANRDPVRMPLSRSKAAPIAEQRMADEDAELLLSILRRLASMGKPCPTNSRLAEMALLKDGESVRYRMGLLQAAGRIEVATPPQGPRVITISATGRKTAKA